MHHTTMTNYSAPICNITEDLATPLFDAIISATMSRERPDVQRFDVQHIYRHIPGGDYPTLAFPCDLHDDLHDDLRHATYDEITDHFNAKAIEWILIDDVRTSQRAHDDDTHHYLADDVIGDIRSGRVPLLTPATRENPPILTKSDTFGSPDTPLRIDGVTVAIHPVAVRMLELFQDICEGTLDPDAVEDVAMKWYLEGVESVLGSQWDTSPHLREALAEVEESSGTIHDCPYEDGVNNAYKVCVQGARYGVSLITLQHYSPCLPGVLAAMRGYRDLTGETPDRHTVIPFAVIRRSVEDWDWNWLMGHIGDVLEDVDDWPYPLKA